MQGRGGKSALRGAWARALLAAVLWLATPSAKAQNLVANPDFETGDVTGWTYVGAAPGSPSYAQAEQYGTSVQGYTYTPAYAGGAWGAFLRAGGGTAQGWSQTIAVVPGEEHVFNLDFGAGERQSSAGGTQTVELRIEGNLVGSQLIPASPYVMVDYNFSGTYTPTGSSITFQVTSTRAANAGTGSPQVYFDNASLVATPPAIPTLSEYGFGALAFALLLVFIVRWRRRPGLAARD